MIPDIIITRLRRRVIITILQPHIRITTAPTMVDIIGVTTADIIGGTMEAITAGTMADTITDTGGS